MRILFISNIAGERAVSSFSKVDVLVAKQLGYEFHLAENYNATSKEAREADEVFFGIKTHHIDFYRTPYDPRNIRAFYQVVKLIKTEKIDAIHCNTPIGGVIGRLAGKKCGIKKIIYQAHGFHFYKGAPLLNWLLYYPIERWLAHYTDAVITINQEDFGRAKSFRLRRGGKVYYVPGVGIDVSPKAISKQDVIVKREEIGVSSDAIVLISVGELNKNKNNQVIIKALKKIGNDNIHYILCGTGPIQHKLQKMSNNRVHFLGYRTDVNELLACSDIFVMPSFREGLSRSLMESMAAGLPAVASNIRGNTDLIINKDLLCNARNASEFANVIEKLCNDEELRQSIGRINQEQVKKYSYETVQNEIIKVYQDIFKK